jgi:hypothetical protein
MQIINMINGGVALGRLQDFLQAGLGWWGGG